MFSFFGPAESQPQKAFDTAVGPRVRGALYSFRVVVGSFPFVMGPWLISILEAGETLSCLAVTSGQREPHHPRGVPLRLLDLPARGRVRRRRRLLRKRFFPWAARSSESPWDHPCAEVCTTPGATALKRIPSFAYSMARLRVTVFRPPLVIIETEALTPAIG